MARLEFGSITFSDSVTSVQLFSGGAGLRATSIMLKPRASNLESVYVNTDSTVSNTNGFELMAGDREDWSFTGSVAAKQLWAIASDSGDVLDWVMEMEN